VFPHCSIHKCTWTAPDEKTHNQVDCILINRRRDLNVLVVQSFREAVCDTDDFMVVAKVRRD
jgi:hypothetical protein